MNERTTPLNLLRKAKKGTTYAKLSYKLRIPERTIIRWLTGKCKISPAYEEIIQSRLQ